MTTADHDFSPDPSLTPQQHRIVTLLAAGHSITQAAAQEQIHRNTVGYWRRTSPAFARELEHAIREQRLYWHEQATQLAPFAIEVIANTLADPDSSPSLRFRAAALILKMAVDPQAKAIPPFATLSPELEAVSGQVHALRKELLASPAVVQPAQTPAPAQICTKPAQQPVRIPPQPGRNTTCPCGSGLKFKRCCLSRPAMEKAA